MFSNVSPCPFGLVGEVTWWGGARGGAEWGGDMSPGGAAVGGGDDIFLGLAEGKFQNFRFSENFKGKTDQLFI